MAFEQMQFTLRDLVAHAIRTLRNPREGARLVMAQNFPASLLWQMLAVVVALSVVLGQGAMLLLVDPAEFAGSLLFRPALMAGLQLGVLVATVFAIHVIGRRMGGVGRFEDALALMVWLQFIMICLQVVQVVLMLVAPPLADMLGLVGFVLFLWLLTSFIAQMHGFQSLVMVFVMILISAMGLVIALSVVLSMFGITGVGELNV